MDRTQFFVPTPPRPGRPAARPSLAGRRVAMALAALALTAGVATAAGCPGRTKRKVISVENIPTSGDGEARARFDEARARFERDDRRAVADFESIAEEYPEDPIAPWALLYAGRSALQAGDYAGAVEHLAALEELADDGEGEVDEQVAERGDLFRGIAHGYLGEHEQAWRYLRRGKNAIADDAERGEWLAAMAEAGARRDRPLRAVKYYDRWYPLATRSERAYIVSRLQTLVGAASAEDARAAYDELSGRETPGEVVLGERVAADWDAAGEPDRARRIREDLAGARKSLRGALEATDRPDAAAAGDPEILGAVLPLTGRRARAGDLAMRGLALASGTFARARGEDMAPFQVAVADTRSTVDGARGAVEEAARRGAVAVIGPIDGRSVDAAATRADALGVPLISLNPRSGRRSKATSPYVFHILQSAEDRAEILARMAVDRGVGRFAILRPDNGYGRVVGGAFRAEVVRLGGEVVAEESYDPRSTSFADVVEKLARSRFDAVFVPDQGSRLELIAPALAAGDLVARPIGSRGRVRRAKKIALLSTAELVSERYVQSSARYSHGALLAPGFYPDLEDPIIGDFAERYRRAFGRLPTASEAFAYDAAFVVRRAVADGARTRTELSGRLAAAEVVGLTGTIAFDDRRRRRDRGLVFEVVKNGDRYAIRALRESPAAGDP